MRLLESVTTREIAVLCTPNLQDSLSFGNWELHQKNAVRAKVPTAGMRSQAASRGKSRRRTGFGDATADGLRERGRVAVRARVQHGDHAALRRCDLLLRPLPATRTAP